MQNNVKLVENIFCHEIVCSEINSCLHNMLTLWCIKIVVTVSTVMQKLQNYMSIDFDFREHYLIGITWKDTSHFLVTWLNRPQNVSILVICDASTSACSNVSQKLRYDQILILGNFYIVPF